MLICVYMCIFVSVNVCIYKCVCMRMCVHVCMYSCMQWYVAFLKRLCNVRNNNINETDIAN